MILERALAEDDVKTNSTKRAGRVTCGSTQDDTEESRHGSQVYTSIQILVRDVKCFTPALCEQVDWHSGATGLHKTISPLEQDGIHCFA